MGNQMSSMKLLLWSTLASYLFSVEAFLRINGSPVRLRTFTMSASHADDTLLKIPFVMDIKSHDMVLGPGYKTLHLTNKKRMEELTLLNQDNTPQPLLEAEELDLKTVTKKWINHCKANNKPVDIKSYDVRDVVSACMKENTLSQIVDSEESPEVIDTIFVTDRELQRIFFQKTKSNKPMSNEDIINSLLYISDEEDMKFEESDSSNEGDNYHRFQYLEQVDSSVVPVHQFYDDASIQDADTLVKVYRGVIDADATKYITLPELSRAWDHRAVAIWGKSKSNEFDPKTALLLLSDNDDEQDAELVDGVVDYIEVRSTPVDKASLASLERVEDENVRELLRATSLELDSQQYSFDYPPLSPISPNVESQFLGVENFMHSKNPLQHRIPANWNDPEQNEWDDSDMYQLVSTMAMPGEPETDFNIKVPVWKILGKSAEDIFPQYGRYIDYIVDTVEDIDQLTLPPVVEWSIRMYSKPSDDGIEGYEDLKQNRTARGMLGAETNRNVFSDMASELTSLGVRSGAMKENTVLVQETDDLSAADNALASLQPDRKLMEEVEYETAVSEEENEAISKILLVDETASYVDDIETSIVDMEDQIAIDIAHPESKWMKYKQLVERRLDKFEQMPNLTEDDIMDEIHDSSETGSLDFDFENLRANSDDGGVSQTQKQQEAEMEFQSMLGDEDHLGKRLSNIVEDAFQEIEDWTGSEDDRTNVFHPKVLKPVFQFTERLEKFQLRRSQDRVRAERESLLLAHAEEEEDKDAPRPKLPKIPTESDLYDNDPEYMDDMKALKQLVQDPEYEEIMNDVDSEVQSSWREYWTTERGRFLDGLKRSLKSGDQQLDGERLWDDIENRGFMSNIDFGDDDYDEFEDYGDDDSESSIKNSDRVDFANDVDDSDDYDVDGEYDDDDNDDEEDDDNFDALESSEQEIEELVATDREHGVHAPNDKYPSKYYPSKLFKRMKEVEEELSLVEPSIDSFFAEFESLKVDVQDIAENVADYQLPFADLESQDLAYDFNDRRVPELEMEMTNELEYIPWMDVYYWEANRERWSQGYYENGAFATPPAWLLRPEYKDMVGYDVWSKYDRRLYFDWEDHMLDEDAFTVHAVSVMREVTDLYMTNHVKVTDELKDFQSRNRYLKEKVRNPAATYPVRQKIPKNLTPDIERGVEYSDELFELRHGRKLGRKLPPLEKRFENDTFSLATDTAADSAIGTILDNYYWKPLQNITHVVEPEKAEILKPLVDYINHMGKLVSTKDDLIIFEYFGPLKHILGLQGSMEYMAKQLYPATTKLRLETERETDIRRLSR